MAYKCATFANNYNNKVRDKSGSNRQITSWAPQPATHSSA